jgi:hypothetical protein
MTEQKNYPEGWDETQEGRESHHLYRKIQSIYMKEITQCYMTRGEERCVDAVWELNWFNQMDEEEREHGVWLEDLGDYMVSRRIYSHGRPKPLEEIYEDGCSYFGDDTVSGFEGAPYRKIYHLNIR